MPEFLKLLPPSQAFDLWLSHFPDFTIKAETLETSYCLNRITAEDIIAPESLPAFSRSTVDGYAVSAAETYGASDSLPAYFVLKGEVPMGGKPDFSISPGEAALIHTGGMLPENADAVVMLEYCSIPKPGEIEVMRAVAPLENIIRVGEDVSRGEVVIPKGTRLRPVEIGGLMSLGILKISVRKIPQIAVLSSGDEVVPPYIKPKIGQVRDINSYAMSAQIEQFGGIPRRYGIIPDNADALRSTINKALEECDAVVVTAGSSASARDITAQIIQESGEPGVLVHGLNIRPGKPTILGLCNGIPVVGLPGNPVSAVVIAWLCFPLLISRLNGEQNSPARTSLTARLMINISSQAGREEWIPVKLEQGEDEIEATPIFFKSSLIFNLAGSDGLMHVPADANGLEVGEKVQVFKL